MACGVNPQGYHSLNFGFFVPKSSFRVKQQRAAARRDAEADGATESENIKGSKKFVSFSLPEIRVKKLLDKTKRRKHSRSHTHGGGSGEKLRLPTISIKTRATVAEAEEERNVKDHHGEGGKRVVKNGEPWWKWPLNRNRGERSPYPQGEGIVQVRSREEDSDSNCEGHQLRQRLPPLVGYRDEGGKVLFSELQNCFQNKTLKSDSRYESGLRVNKRYYYSKSRDGLRPCIPGAKLTVSHACLFDLSSSSKASSSNRRVHVLNSMQDELQALPGMASNNGFLGAHLGSLNSTMGTRVKQSLSKSQMEREVNMQLAKDDESLAQNKSKRRKNIRRTQLELNVNDSSAESEGEVVSFAQTKKATHRRLKALAILEELIDILSATENLKDGRYTNSSGAKALSNITRDHSTLTQINVSDFFQKPEEELKEYDRFKELLSSINNAQLHRRSLNTIAEEEEEYKEEKDSCGLTQLLAIQPLQTVGETTSSSNRINVSKPLPSICKDKINEVDEVNDERLFRNKYKSVPESCKSSNPLLMHVDLNSQFLEFSQGVHKRSKPANVGSGTSRMNIGHLHSSQYSLHSQEEKFESSCNVDPQLICINLNDQYLEFADGTHKRSNGRHSDPNKVVKLQEVEHIERAGNPRPDLEISGENLKHLHSLGYFDKDEELGNIAKNATGNVTINHEQLRKLQKIYNVVTTGAATTHHPDSVSDFDQRMKEDVLSQGFLPEFGLENQGMEEAGIYHYAEHPSLQGDTFSKPELGRDVYESQITNVNESLGDHRKKSLTIIHSAEMMSGHLEGHDQHRPGDGSHCEQSVEMSDSELKARALELERQQQLRALEMERQRKLMIKQRMKEEKILESVRRDLEHFQESLNSSGSPEKKPHKERESLLPPPPPPRKKAKASPSRHSNGKRNQQLAGDDDSLSPGKSTSEVNGGDDENNKAYGSETIGDESTNMDKDQQEFADGCEESESTGGEFDDIGNQDFDREGEFGVVTDSEEEEEQDGGIHHGGSELAEEEDSYPLAVSECSSQPRLSSKTTLSSTDEKLVGEVNDVHTTSKPGVSDTKRELSTETVLKNNTGATAAEKAHATTFNMGPLSEGDGGVSALSESRANSRGFGGSSLPRSQKVKHQQSSMSILSGLAVTQPETVKSIEIEAREQSDSRQSSRAPTREKPSSRGRVVIADSSQLRAHRKAQLAKQELAEAKRREAELEKEREEKRLEKKIHQIEFEEKMNKEFNFEKEQDEIRRQRQLKEEARKKAEELEAQRQLLVKEMLKQEAEREAQEKARHAAMLDMLRREAELRHQDMLYERAAMEDYQNTIDVWNDWEYACIDNAMGEKFSQLARKADQARELEAKQLIQQRMREAFEFKRRELLEKLKAAQKQLMLDMAMDQGSLDHFLNISRAFVFTYFQRVPDQTYMVPQEMLM